MIIYPKRVEAISKIGLPNSHKAMQSFLGKINFVRRFVPNFSQVVKPMQFLVKKDVPFKWSKEQKNICILDKNAKGIISCAHDKSKEDLVPSTFKYM